MNINNFVSKIKSKENYSDKYSLLLYKFLYKNRNKFPFKYDFKILYDATTNSFNPSFPKVQNMYIGGLPLEEEPHTFFGNRINSIICNTSKEIWCMHLWSTSYHGGKTPQIINITEWFIENYIKIGRCLFDPHHTDFMMNTESRYTELLLPNYVELANRGEQITDQNTKHCNWCGKTLHKVIKEEVVIKTKETWVAF